MVVFLLQFFFSPCLPGEREDVSTSARALEFKKKKNLTTSHSFAQLL
jgi:hypothetical protein